MADVTYRIILKGAGGGGGAKPKSTATTPNGEDVSPKETTESDLYGAYRKIRNSAPAALALKYAKKDIVTEINRIDLRTGRTTYQQQQQWIYNTSLQSVGIVTAIVGGVVSANPLIVLGGAVAAVDKVVDYAIAQENINLERRVENIGIGMANIRAGSGGDRHSRATY